MKNLAILLLLCASAISITPVPVYMHKAGASSYHVEDYKTCPYVKPLAIYEPITMEKIRELDLTPCSGCEPMEPYIDPNLVIVLQGPIGYIGINPNACYSALTVIGNVNSIESSRQAGTWFVLKGFIP